MVVEAFLSDEERKHWDENGFLLVKNCLSGAEVSRLVSVLSDLSEKSADWSEEQRKAYLSSAGNGKHVDIVGLPLVSEEADFLLDHPNIFGRLLSLMGPYIYSPGMEYLERYPHANQLLRLHTDGGGSFRSIFPSPESLVLQLKVQFFLTDTDKPESGNFMMVPGSHHKRFPLDEEGIEQATKAAVPILANKGDALIFPWSLWHAVSANTSGNTRKSVISRYAQLWMRPVHYNKVPEAVTQRLSERRRRLLADLAECETQNDLYHPDFDTQIRTMFGDEWANHPDIPRYEMMNKPLKKLFDQ
jgi:ectoine hydroxylase-related dioxygenase (phytanoyl-CoA dioxygenase family)